MHGESEEESWREKAKAPQHANSGGGTYQGLLLQRASWRNDGEVCAAEAEGFCGAESQRMGEERSGRSPRSFFSRAALHDGPLLKNEER